MGNEKSEWDKRQRDILRERQRDNTDRWLSKSKTWHRVSSEESSYLDLRGLSEMHTARS